MEEKIEENLVRDQFGFHKNWSTESLKLNKEIMIAFINIKKAFDNTDWNIIFEVLRVD